VGLSAWHDGCRQFTLAPGVLDILTQLPQRMSSQPLAIVLAAGKGKRMATQLPKVLVPVLGRPMIRYVVEAIRAAGVPRIVAVVGYRGELVREELAGELGVEFAEQTEQLGTGHAIMMCRDALAAHSGPVLILAGDSPMVQVSSLTALLTEFNTRRPACLLGTATKADPAGMGRIVRSPSGEFLGIVEEKDATPAQRAVTEVNMSTYLFSPQALLWSLNQLTADNAQGEYYLTDCPGVLKAAGELVLALQALKPCESLSINTLEDLAAVESEMATMVSK
jgi:bifunctional UDP-N-acetylglucosamine pyrophosphorylase/glucosamine-1-phosphate N-acetyltransferase/UDP-N-acetylglucosamine pyrophosphorylase